MCYVLIGQLLTESPRPWGSCLHSHRLLSKLKTNKDRKCWEKVFVPLCAAKKSSLYLNLKEEQKMDQRIRPGFSCSLGGTSTHLFLLVPALVWIAVVAERESNLSMPLLSESDHRKDKEPGSGSSMAHTFNHSSWKSETDRSLSSSTA